jgi:hypothetical protein
MSFPALVRHRSPILADRSMKDLAQDLRGTILVGSPADMRIADEAIGAALPPAHAPAIGQIYSEGP